MKIYREVKASEELPETEGRILTSEGWLWYDNTGMGGRRRLS